MEERPKEGNTQVTVIATHGERERQKEIWYRGGERGRGSEIAGERESQRGVSTTKSQRGVNTIKLG